MSVWYSLNFRSDTEQLSSGIGLANLCEGNWRGPNSIGKRSERKITARDRGISISSIGKIDVDVWTFTDFTEVIL